ncbi:MAG: MlaD family protein [Vicinamibacterales bacterium]
MPRTRSLAYAELKIGILTVTALSLAATVVFMLSSEGGFFWQRYSLKTRFPNVAGLVTGSPVRLAGIEVGSVTSITLTGAEAEVVYEVLTRYREQVTNRSRATLGTVSLLGQGTVDITPAPGGTPVPEWGYVPAGSPVVQVSDVTASASQGLTAAARLLNDVREGRGTIGRLFTDEALYRELRRFAEAARDVAAGLNQGKGTVGRLLSDPEVYADLESAMANLEAITAKIGAGEGSLGRLVHDEEFGRSLTASVDALESIAAKIDRGEGTLGRLANDTALYDRLSNVAERLENVTGSLAESEGTAGRLLHDRQLYENLNQAAAEVRALIADIRKDPRKYLNVRLSIF